jgi:hypothetical protein
MSKREEIIDLIRNEYDPKPNLAHGDYPAFDWDDGAGRIADTILANERVLLQRIDALETALRNVAKATEQDK